MSPTFGPVPDNGRFPYRAINQRPDFTWPDGKRLAVYIGFNLEHFAFGEGLGAGIGPLSPQPDVLNYSWREYGNRVGAWRCLELFDRLCLPTAALINTALFDHCPAPIRSRAQNSRAFWGIAVATRSGELWRREACCGRQYAQRKQSKPPRRDSCQAVSLRPKNAARAAASFRLWLKHEALRGLPRHPNWDAIFMDEKSA